MARRSLDVLISGETGMVIDIRRDDPLTGTVDGLVVS